MLFFIQKPKLLPVLCHTLFGGIATICLVVQTVYYATDSLYVSKMALVPFFVAGISGIMYKFMLVLRNGKASSLRPLLWGAPALLIVNLGLIVAGPSEYRGSNNPDMWYYAAVSRNIADSNTSYLRFHESLLITANSFIAPGSAIGALFSVEEKWRADLRAAIQDKYVEDRYSQPGCSSCLDSKLAIQKQFVGDRYYYFPGETPLINGVSTRNGTEFFVALMSSLGKINVITVYNVLGGLYLFLLCLAGLWLSQLYKLNLLTQNMVVLFISLSALVHGAVFTQWPGMYLGIPIIFYLIGLLKCHFLVPSHKSGFFLAFICVAAMAIYPEGLVVAVIPCAAFIITAFISKRPQFIKALKSAFIYFPLILITIGIPALFLTLYRVIRITGKFTAMPGPEYTETFAVFYKFWIQPAWIGNNIFWDQNGDWVKNLLVFDMLSLTHLLFLIGGAWVSTFMIMSLVLTSGKSRRVITPYWLGMMIPLIYLYGIGSPYAIDKLFYYSAIPIALILGVGFQHLVGGGGKSMIVAWVTAIFYVAINLPTLIQLTGYEIRSRFPLDDYTDLSRLSKITGQNEKILSVLPDMSPQLWATHYISDLPVVMLNGIFYLENYVSQAYIKQGDKYLSNYHYMLIPGEAYPNIEKYDYVSSIVWSNRMFRLTKKGYVFQVYDDKPKMPRKENNFYDTEGYGEHAFRWINYRIAGKYVNADLKSTYRATYDCEPAGGKAATLQLRLNNVVLNTQKIHGRTKIKIDNLALGLDTGTLALNNITYEPTFFPRDVRPISFRCFGFSLQPEKQAQSS